MKETYPTSAMNCATLYYDGNCPLCASEMRLLNKLARREELQLVNIHTLPDLSAQQKSLFLRRLHLRQADGSWLTSVDASVTAWSSTTFGFLLKPLRWRCFAAIVDKAYARWADRRYCNRYACDLKKTAAANGRGR